MAHLFPHLEEQIYSKKTPEDIYMILASITDSRKINFSTNAEFIGQVHPFDFEIFPRLGYRNSFLPILTGKIMENEGETVIDMKAEMHIFTRVFLVFWFGMSCFSFLCGIIAVLCGFEEIALILVSLSFIIFGQIMMRCCFYGPARKAFKMLKELLC